MAALRVLITIGQLNVGGAERRLLQLIESLAMHPAKIEVAMFVVSGMPGSLDTNYRAAGAHLYYGKTGVAGLVRLSQICRSWRPDVLHVNADAAAGFYGAAGLLSGVKVRIAHFRQTRPEEKWPRRLRTRAYELITNLFCNRHIGVCEAARSDRWLFRSWSTIYNGICVPDCDVLAAQPMPSGYSRSALRVVVLGRLTKQKNIARAIEIFATLHERVPVSQLHLVGPCVDIETAEILAWAKQLGVDKQVVLHGETDSPWSYLIHASACLMPSRSEGLPGVVLESLACGTPVVASDLPGIREIASRTTGVTMLSLNVSNEQWASELIVAATRSRTEILSAFAQSEFQVNRYVERIVTHWSNGVGVRGAT